MMGWFTSLFSSPSSTTDTRRNSLMSTLEAFSITPNASRGPDSSSRYAGSISDFSSTAGTSYAYPPSSNSTYDYVPTTASIARGSRQSSLLPLHHTPLTPQPPYPPLARTWVRLRNWLSNEYPELGDTLNWGIQPQDLAEAEHILGQALPQVIRESYLIVDGQEAESSAGCSEGLFFGLTLLPLEDVVEEWRFWREVDDDPSTGANPRLKEVMQSIPTGWVRREYSQRGWIPLVTDKAGNYLGIDLNPDDSGTVGQVIVFGRDFDTKVVMFRGQGQAGWAKWLSNFVDELESGEGFELGAAHDGSDDSEDSLGYESYFFDGSGRSKGEGGGDTGTGGIRLTGDYRGWNVLEAWADRSLRLWREAGLVTEFPDASAPTESISHVGLGVLNVAEEQSGSGSEIPIPIITEPPPSTVENVSKSSGPPFRRPTISVTMPPVYPVDLPTPPQNVSPTTTTMLSFDQDLERGPISLTDNIDHPLKNDTFTLQSRGNKREELSSVREATLVPLSTEDISSERPPIPSTETPQVVDLLQTDSNDNVKIIPMEPAVSLDERKTDPISLNSDSAIAVSPISVQSPDNELDQLDPDKTIRLVDGVYGVAINGKLPSISTTARDREPIDGTTSSSSASVNSPTSPTVQKTNAKHEKRKSLSSGLKMFRQSSGKQKAGKDSIAT